MCSRPKTNRIIQTFISNKSKTKLCDVWGCICALGKDNLQQCDGNINADKYNGILEQNSLPSTDVHHFFNLRVQNHILHNKSIADKEEGTGTGLTCSNKEVCIQWHTFGCVCRNNEIK